MGRHISSRGFLRVVGLKWRELEGVITGKLRSEIKRGSGHDYGMIRCNGLYVGRVKIGHHGEMKPREVGGSARMLKINEHQLKTLVGCSLSQSEYCALVAEKGK